MEEALLRSRLTTTIFSCFQPLLIPFHLSIWERCFNHRLYLHFQLQSHFRVSECTSDIFSDTELTRNSDQNSNLLKLCILHLLIKLYNFHYFASPNSAYFALETSYKLLPRRQNLLRPRAAEIFPRASGASTAKRGAIGKIPRTCRIPGLRSKNRWSKKKDVALCTAKRDPIPVPEIDF